MFDINPLDDHPDPHGECRLEIRRLEAELQQLAAAVSEEPSAKTKLPGWAQRIWQSLTRLNDKAEFKHVIRHIETLEEEITRLRDMLSKARTDIFHWVALAEKQRLELPNANNLPCAPTLAGIETSKKLLEEIHQAMRKS